MQRSLAYARSKPDPVRVDKPSEKAARARLADAQVASRRSVRLPLLAPPEKAEDARRSISGAKTQQSNRQVGRFSRSGTPALSLVYRAPAQGLSLEMRNHLRILAFDLRRDRALRVELKGSDASRSRDLAWARAMEVHAFLLDEEISPDRIFVQAVEPLDLAGESGRVDVVLTPRPKS